MNHPVHPEVSLSTIMKPAFVYSPKYDVDAGGHVFPFRKYKLIRARLIEEGLVGADEFIEPQAPPEEDILLVHTPAYLDDLKTLRWTARTIRSELPLTHEIVQGFVVAAAGTTIAAREALDRGMSVHVGGGLHHAYPDHGEGFCYINDIGVGIRKLQTEKLIEKALVADCDLHQGNGTAVIFQEDPFVFTFSIHQENLYPIKERSDLDIGLSDFVGDGEYLAHLREIVPRMLDDHKPDIVVYAAGADPYKGDQLGTLQLSIEGLKNRDEIVLGECKKRGIPGVVVLAGGYAWDTADTVEIHLNTCKVALELCA